jgi:myo-inositol-1(or 4)-monophosphatase
MSWQHERMVQLLTEAGALARSWKKSLTRERKADQSIVTQADLAVEALLADELERPAEGVYFIGEETLAQKGEDYLQQALRGEAYVVDPIDGTVPYAYGVPNWGVSIGHLVDGKLTDGAVYLPDFGELVISDGADVLEGTLTAKSFEWRVLPDAHPDGGENAPIAITQRIAKQGKVLLPNPTMVLGAAVVPLVGLTQRRFVGYLGSVKLWDIAGSLPLVLRRGFVASLFVDGERRELTTQVHDATYHLDAKDSQRWWLRSNLLVCHPEDEPWLRTGLVSGEGSPTATDA